MVIDGYIITTLLTLTHARTYTYTYTHTESSVPKLLPCKAVYTSYTESDKALHGVWLRQTKAHTHAKYIDSI